MHITNIFFSGLLSLVGAQTSVVPGSGGTCGTIALLDACLGTTQSAAATCASADYACLCQMYTSIVGCFASSACPQDPRWQGIYSNQQAYCADSSVYTSGPTSTASLMSSISSGASILIDTSNPTTRISNATGTVTKTSSGSGAKTTSGGGSGSKTSSGTTSGTTSAVANAARGRNMMVEAGGVVVGLAGWVGVML